MHSEVQTLTKHVIASLVNKLYGLTQIMPESVVSVLRLRSKCAVCVYRDVQVLTHCISPTQRILLSQQTANAPVRVIHQLVFVTEVVYCDTRALYQRYVLHGICAS